MEVKIKLNNVELPEYKTSGSSAFDISALITEEESDVIWQSIKAQHLSNSKEKNMILIEPYHIYKIKTGLSFEIPKGYEIQVRPRSGISSKTFLDVPCFINSLISFSEI